MSMMSNVRQVSSRRSFVLMGSGALAGLLMAGYSLFTARGTSTLVVPPEDVALVNQQPISRSDYLQQLQTLYGVDLRHATVTQRRKVRRRDRLPRRRHSAPVRGSGIRQDPVCFLGTATGSGCPGHWVPPWHRPA